MAEIRPTFKQIMSYLRSVPHSTDLEMARMDFHDLSLNEKLDVLFIALVHNSSASMEIADVVRKLVLERGQ